VSTELASPDFDQLANLLIDEGALAYSPSELHGVIVGQIAAGQRFDQVSLAAFCIQQLDIDGLAQSDSKKQLNLLYSDVLKQLESSSFELVLLLPDDEHSLAQRAEQLGFWVTGFLAGFGLGVGQGDLKLGTEAQESLGDLVQISQIESDSDSEEDEGLLMEVEEYVRMAAMLLFTECNTSSDSAGSDNVPTLH